MTNGKDVIYTVANASNNDVYLYKDNKTKRLFSFKGTIKLITVQNNFLYFVNGDSHLCEYDYVNNKVTVMFGVDVHDVVSLEKEFILKYAVLTILMIYMNIIPKIIILFHCFRIVN